MPTGFSIAKKDGKSKPDNDQYGSSSDPSQTQAYENTSGVVQQDVLHSEVHCRLLLCPVLVPTMFAADLTDENSCIEGDSTRLLHREQRFWCVVLRPCHVVRQKCICYIVKLEVRKIQVWGELNKVSPI